jgi:hypothetical protein
MELWRNIINTAMLGTDKKTIEANELPAELSTPGDIIFSNEALNKEDKFLQIAALVFNYRQSGVQALEQKEISIAVAEAEEKKYCIAPALQALNDILYEDNIPLLQFWLRLCASNNLIAPPEMLPALFFAGNTNKNLQNLVAACCGNRGKWLSGFNESWNFSSAQSTEELWQSGSPEQRKQVLSGYRKVSPGKALQLLSESWGQEDAATKLNWLEILSTNIGEEDIPFLEQLGTEKSKKVKDEAGRLLKLIPTAPIVKKYQLFLQNVVTIKKEKALLGLSSKTTIHFKLDTAPDTSMLKSGIEELSNNKALSDEEFIIYQLIESVPANFWEQHFALEPEAIISYFQRDTCGEKMLPALVNAIRKFNDQRWALAFLKNTDAFYIDIIPLLPAAEQEYYCLKYFNEYPENIIQYAIKFASEWSSALSIEIFKYCAKKPYQYGRTFFNQHIQLIPIAVEKDMEKFAASDEYLRNSWLNTCEAITKLLRVKSQTIQSFK